MTRPLILISNDDGYRASGIRVLADLAAEFGDVLVSAPQEERSGTSQALSFRSMLRADKVQDGWLAVDGTPADSVYLGMLHHAERPVALVLSGINDGYNLGSDVYYSGTVGAAREGYFRGASAVAVSVDRGADPRAVVPSLRLLVGRVLANHERGERCFLNVNCPRDPASVTPVLTRLGERRYADQVVRRVDMSGRDYFWIGGPAIAAESHTNLDTGAVQAGYVSLTPMKIDVTDGDPELWRSRLL